MEELLLTAALCWENGQCQYTVIILFLSIIIKLCKVLMIFHMNCLECLITLHSSPLIGGNVILLAKGWFLSFISSKVNVLVWKNKLVEFIYLYVSPGKRHICMLDPEWNLIMRKDNIGRIYLWHFILIVFLMQICDYLLFQYTLNEGFEVLEDDDKDISVNVGT